MPKARVKKLPIRKLNIGTGDSMTGYQWSWSAVKRIVANGGKFRS